jgi:hypothetical protein
MMRRLPVAAGLVTSALALAACGSGSSGGGAPSTDPSSNPTAAKAAVTRLYNTFFSAPIAQAKTMLQDGQSLNKAFQIANQLKGNNTESAKVKSVTLNSNNTASVVYELDANGSPVIAKSNGEAVYVNGKWLVSKTTFCNLVSLGHPGPIPGC